MSVVVEIDGREFRDWKTFEASRSLDEASPSFTLTVSEASAVPPEWNAPELKAGKTCRLLLAGKLAITGRLDQIDRRFDAESHEVQIAGRGKTADLVDSSVILEGGGQLKNQTLDQIAQKVAAPFGIEIVLQGDPGEPFANAQVQTGETAFEFLERLARQRGFLLHDDKQGRLRFDRGPREGGKAALEEGRNLLAGESSEKADERHSEYIVKGQRKGDDHVFGEDAAHIEARVRDDAVEGHRPLIVLAEGWTDQAAARRRADWEATKRAADAVSAHATVHGWLRDDGEIWDAGDKVDVASPTLALDREMVVSQITWLLDSEGGEVAELTLVVPESLDPEKTAPAQSSGSAAASPAKARRENATEAAPSGFTASDVWSSAKPAERAK